jgi:hypothetical protein
MGFNMFSNGAVASYFSPCSPYILLPPRLSKQRPRRRHTNTSSHAVQPHISSKSSIMASAANLDKNTKDCQDSPGSHVEVARACGSRAAIMVTR